MKIKSSKTSFFPKMILIVLISLLVLVLGMVLCTNDVIETDLPKKIQANKALPPSVQQFIEKPANLEEVLDFFKEEEIFIGIKDEASAKFSKEMREKVRELGGKKWSKIGFREAYAGYFKNGKIIQEESSKDGIASIEAGGGVLKSASTNRNKAGEDKLEVFCNLTIYRNIFENDKRGLHVFVKSKYEKQIFHYVFDFFAKAQPLSTAELGIIKYSELEQIELVLDEKAFEKIEAKRQEALNLNLLITEEEDWVNAKVVYNNKTYEVETRLKGDLFDHFVGDKWSFRIKMKDEETIMGMRKFSLHRPFTRNYVGEWLFHQMLAKENILHLNYQFVHFWLHKPDNGIFQRKDMRIYALEEAFDKLVFERQQRRAGVIIKFDESIFWEERAAFMKEGFTEKDLLYINFQKYKDFNIIPFGEKTVMRDSVLRKQFNVARNLLQSYISGTRKATEVFDVEKLIRYNIICNMFGAHHALIPRNWRLYYNPITSRLEPIGFDANGVNEISALRFFEWASNDLEYIRIYNQQMQTFIESQAYKTWNEFPGLKEQIEYLQQEYKSFKWDEKTFHRNFLVLQNSVLPIRSINVYLEQLEKEILTFTIENFGVVPVELKDIRHKDNRIFGSLISDEIVMPGEKKQVTYRLNTDFKKLFVNKKKRKSTFELHEDIKKVHLTWNTIGTTQIREAEIFPWREEDSTIKASFFERRAPKEVPKKPFLVVDEQNKIIQFKKGIWDLTQPCRLPAGYIVQMHSGSHFRLKNKYGQIISYSPIHFIGTKEAPIIIESHTGEGGGIFVMGSPDTSIIKHCLFDNLGIPQLPGWSLSGAVNFFENPVKISHTVFKNNRTEDGLNIINSYFELDNVAFANTQSDAFDGDFVQGKITNSTFRNIGNDAIDVSGADLVVQNVLIVNAGDKGLSAGEKSKMVAQEIIIQDSEVAVASKDLSEMTIHQLVLKTNKLGFAAFQKKPEFGPCHIEATNIQLENNELDYLIERNSSLKLNGKIVPVSDGVKERMYGVEFGKSSR